MCDWGGGAERKREECKFSATKGGKKGSFVHQKEREGVEQCIVCVLQRECGKKNGALFLWYKKGRKTSTKLR